MNWRSFLFSQNFVRFVPKFEFLHDDGFISSVYQIGNTPIGNKNESVVMCAKNSTWHFKLIPCKKVNHSILRSISVVWKMMLCANEKILIVYFQNEGARNGRKSAIAAKTHHQSYFCLETTERCYCVADATPTTFTVLLLLLFYFVQPLQWHTK